MEINEILGGKTRVIDIEVSEQVLKRINKYMKKNIIVSRRKLLSLVVAEYFLQDVTKECYKNQLDMCIGDLNDNE